MDVFFVVDVFLLQVAARAGDGLRKRPAPLRCRAGVVCCFKFLVGALFIVRFVLSMVLVL